MQGNIANSMGSDLTTQQKTSVDLQQADRHAVFFSGKVEKGGSHDWAVSSIGHIAGSRGLWCVSKQ